MSVCRLNKQFLTGAASVRLLDGQNLHQDIWLSNQVPAGGFRVVLMWGNEDAPASLSTYAPSECVIHAAGGSCASVGVGAHAETWKMDNGGPQSVLFTQASANGEYQIFASLNGAEGEEWGARSARVIVYLPACGAMGVRRFLLRSGDGLTGTGLGPDFVAAPRPPGPVSVIAAGGEDAAPVEGETASADGGQEVPHEGTYTAPPPVSRAGNVW